MANHPNSTEPSKSPSSETLGEAGFITRSAGRLASLIEHYRVLSAGLDNRLPRRQLETLLEARLAMENAILNAQAVTAAEAVLQVLLVANRVDELEAEGECMCTQHIVLMMERGLRSAAEHFAPLGAETPLAVLNDRHYRHPGLYPFPKIDGFVV